MSPAHLVGLKIRVSAVQFRPWPLARDARFQRRIRTRFTPVVVPYSTRICPVSAPCDQTGGTRQPTERGPGKGGDIVYADLFCHEI